MNTFKNRKRVNDAPICRYGLACYQKNPDHHKKYSHPSNLQEELLPDSSHDSNDSLHPTVKNASTLPKTKNELVLESQESSVDAVLKNMPNDFFDFWRFCSTINESKPQDAFVDLGIELVGTYDLLSKNLPKDQKVNLDCHYRYYYDPPEFQTVVAASGNEQFHIGYLRDDPSELPSILASNSVSLGPKLTLKGDNIFAAMNVELKDRISKLKSQKAKEKFEKVKQSLGKFASNNNYSLDLQTTKTRARSKRVVAKTFHGLGIVVPVKNDIGYRPLPDSNATIKSILKKIASAKTEDDRLCQEESLDELMNNVNLANDECDYGMGLELGIDIFCFGETYFHMHIANLLTLAYKLLNRPQYVNIITNHLKDRQKSEPLIVIDL